MKIGFTYPGEEKETLTDVSLNLKAGQTVGLLGANGAGKSTLLGVLTSSLMGNTLGTLEVHSGAHMPIGFATQEIGLYNHLTLHENLVHAARLATNSWEVDGLVGQAVKDFALTPFVERGVRHLSGGQKRIGHLACAFVHQPSIRLLDEPTTSLDFNTREHLLNLVEEWRLDGKTILVTAHYPEDIEEMCTHLVVLVRGETHDLGLLGDVLSERSLIASAERSSGRITFEVTELTLESFVSAAVASGVSTNERLEALSARQPSLRDLLRQDPNLGASVAAPNVRSI